MSEKEKEVLSLFEGWDFDMNKELICPSVFEYFRLNLLRNILSDELGDLIKEISLNIADNYLHLIADKGDDPLIDNINTEKKESIGRYSTGQF